MSRRTPICGQGVMLALFCMHTALVQAVCGQILDTLRHHDPGIPLELYRYDLAAAAGVGEGRGLLLGHNSHYRQQYAERYRIAKGDRVRGMVVHLGGVFAHGEHLARFRIYTVAKNGLPGSLIAEKAVAYRDLDLSGQAMRVDFDSVIEIGNTGNTSATDSFFVAFDLGDYAHGGYAGDTLGLYACESGCRSQADLDLFGRNAVQWHNHDKIDWHDFYYQNFTPLAIHFAIYPVIERNAAAIARKPTLKPSFPARILNLDLLGRRAKEVSKGTPKDRAHYWSKR